MTNDQTARSARRAATVVAVPLALLTGFIAFQVLKPSPAPEPQASPSPQPQSTEPVTMPALALSEQQTLVCKAFLSRLPDSVGPDKRRQVTAGQEQNAAFGDPPVTVACGGAQPTFPPTDPVVSTNRVCWHADDASRSWTTTDRQVPVTVTVPQDRSGAKWLTSLSPAIAASIRPIEGPWGCEHS